MSSIGILGAGNVAHTLARGWAKAGHQVIIGGRRAVPPDWIAEAGATASSLAGAALADVVVNALPGEASPAIISTLAGALTGKVLIDVANAVETDASGFAVALRYQRGSLAETLKGAAPGALVVKTLNTMHESVMAAPESLTTPANAFLSGDDREAKQLAAALLADLGWQKNAIIDLGDLASARVVENFILLVKPLVLALGPVPFAFSVAR